MYNIREQIRSSNKVKELAEELARESRKFGEKYQEEEGEKIFFIHGRRVSCREWGDWQFKKKELERDKMIRESLEKQRIRTQKRLEKERVEQA